MAPGERNQTGAIRCAQRRYHGDVVATRPIPEIGATEWRLGNGARVVWREAKSGRKQAIETPFVIITIPLPVLRTIPADFTADIRAAIAAVDYLPAGKVAFQAERRFWELDETIYGGISWTSRDITQIWYPSTNFHGTDGILLGAYVWSHDIGERLAALPPAERIRLAVNGAAARPLRLRAVEDAVRGKPATAATGELAGKLAVQGAVPLQFNAYKIPLMRNLVKRAIGGVEEARWPS